MKTVQNSTRRFTQVLFSIIVVYMGIQFYFFVSSFEKGVVPNFARPAGVEAFLPISALVGLKHWLYTGTINTIHPAALILLLIICFTALFAKKGFCSWVCPIGLLSEYLAQFHRFVYKRNVSLPLIPDMVLRVLKYVIAGFFIYQIFYKMPFSHVEQFILSPYNRFADIKMLKFFTHMSTTTLVVLIGLMVLSVFIENLWCRYLCPYGALLGGIGFLSLGKIRRNPAHCTGCGKCEKVCPGHIAIKEKRDINSPECSTCLACIDVCPEEEAIQFSMAALNRPLKAFSLAMFFFFVFTVGISIAKLTDTWQNKVSNREYLTYLMPAGHAFKAGAPSRSEKMQQIILIMKQLKEQQFHVQGTHIDKGD